MPTDSINFNVIKTITSNTVVSSAYAKIETYGSQNNYPLIIYDTHVTIIETCLMLAVKEESEKIKISLYPNPFIENIVVQLPHNFVITKTKFTITNNLGQILLTSYPDSFSQLLNLSQLTSGMYFLTVQDNSNKKTVKIIKQ